MKKYSLAVISILSIAAVLLVPGCAREYSGVATQEFLDLPWEAGTFPADSVRSLITRRLQTEALDERDWSPKSRELVTSFYANRDHDPAWTNEGELRPHAEAFLKDMCSVDLDGLLASDYRPDLVSHALKSYVLRPTPATLAELDLTLTWSFMQYSYDLMGGRVDPQSLRSEVYLRAPDIPLDSLLTSVLSMDPPTSFGATLRPRHAHYEELRDHMERYRRIEARGGWPVVPGTENLSAGDSGPRVSTLIDRLVISGDLERAAVTSDTTYDKSVAEGVAKFQARHGIIVDSIVTDVTLKAINVPVQGRIEQIERNLERWRWLPADLGRRYVYVNIPAFLVYGYIDGQEDLRMRVVVGSEYGDKQTPVFSDEMDRVIFRPYWNIPGGIAANEVVPKGRRDPSWLTRNHYEILDRNSGLVMPLDEVDLSEVPSAKYRIRQAPGPHNALGLVKYIFPNRHGIYLHDTPADHLFKLPERDFSHGCIRLEKPDVFGQHILGERGWSLDDVRRAINGDERKVVWLEEKIPVYIMYNTAFVEDGVMHFRDDIYGYDAALDAALSAQKERSKNLAAETRDACGDLRLLRQAI